MANESIGRTLLVAVAVCAACSVLVSTSAVVLKPKQDANKLREVKQNILAAAGVPREQIDVPDKQFRELYRKLIEEKVVDLDTGEFLSGVDADSIDDRKEAKSPKLSRPIPDEKDLGGIKRRANRRVVYLFREGGALKRIILPVYGKGLWSTLYGLLALSPDGKTIESLAFYEHAETPGLGGEIDNPRWKAHWVGKKPWDEEGRPAITVIKGTVDPHSSEAAHQIDGISGATITGRGVMNLVRYWLGEDGYGPMLGKLRD